MTRAITILELLASGRDEAVALAAPGRKPLSHAGLRRHVAGTARRLQELGIGRVDRVAETAAGVVRERLARRRVVEAA